jgi:flagellin-like hook-associated protein FlgL
MSVSGIAGFSLVSMQAVLDMRHQLDELQRQLGTGKIAASYAGLGLDRGLTVGLRSQLSAISGYQHTITQVGVRLDLMQAALAQFGTVAQTAKNMILQSQFVLHGDTQTQDQKYVLNQLNQLVALLNTKADDRYLFSGRSVDQPPVVSADQMISGDGARAGLKQVTAERRLADLGADGLGRLVIGTPSATAVSLAEDAVSPFGFKLAGVNSGLSGATVTGPSGSPASLTVDLAGGNPNDGETIRFAFTLPDGTAEDLTLTATTSATPGPGQFTIGATPDVTAANLTAALTQGLSALAGSALVAASAVAAGNDFFNIDDSNPPKRVAGPPFETATTLINGTPTDTVSWYAGDGASDDPRSTALARADQSLTVSYGVRANEEALRRTVQSLAVFATATFSDGDPSAESQYAALRERLGAILVGVPNEQKLSDIQGGLAAAQSAISAAKDRHQQTAATLQNLLQSIEGVPTEQVGAQILSLQTSFQATLQTTAMLLQTNLLKYL